MLRLRKNVIADFSNLPAAPTFSDVSAIGKLAIEDFLSKKVDEVFVVYTDFVNMVKQIPTVKKILPLEYQYETERVETFEVNTRQRIEATYIYDRI